MKAFSKKRLLVVGAAVTSVGAAAALLAGATFGLFSSAGISSGASTFTAGKVAVGLGAGTTVVCTVSPMSPGDNQASNGSSGQNATCQYDVKYTGNVKAFLALDLTISGTAGTQTAIPYTQTTAPTGAQGLYDGTGTGLQFNIADNTGTTYMAGVQYTNVGNAATTLTPTAGAATVLDLLVNTVPVVQNDTRHLTVNYNLPIGAGNAYNLATSTITLTIHAVQADNNALPSGCTHLGAQCDTTTSSMNWS
jgi:hypothetical protein